MARRGRDGKREYLFAMRARAVGHPNEMERVAFRLRAVQQKLRMAIRSSV
jgi:hypothetical protein